MRVGRRLSVGAALLWCVAATWWTYGRDARVPGLALVDLGFHELGHLVGYVVPVSALLTAALGSIFQVAVPLGLAAYFLVRRRDGVAASVCCTWAATSAHDVATYVADAPFEALPLIGGEHDWAYILGPEQLDRLDQAARYATYVRGIGAVVLLLAAGLAVDVALRAGRRPPLDPRALVAVRVLDDGASILPCTPTPAASAAPAATPPPPHTGVEGPPRAPSAAPTPRESMVT